MQFFSEVYDILNTPVVEQKLERTQQLFDTTDADVITQALKHDAKIEPISVARPDKPQLVSPNALSQRSLSSLEGRAALIHAIAHIEFNAIHLALDAVYRFRQMPVQYYLDWLLVAKEEAYHFTLLRDHLTTLGYTYGDFVAHNGLWEMAEHTTYDVMVRMALVPRLLEARGLDVTPGIQAKLSNIGDHEAVKILDIIFHDEKGHVRIGNHWFLFCCQARGLAPMDTFQALLNQHAEGKVRPPIGRQARLEAGFTDDEVSYLEGLIA